MYFRLDMLSSSPDHVNIIRESRISNVLGCGIKQEHGLHEVLLVKT